MKKYKTPNPSYMVPVWVLPLAILVAISATFTVVVVGLHLKNYFFGS